MHPEKERALNDLAALGFRGRDVYLAELIPLVEMAWADGEIQPAERQLLEAACEDLVERLNHDCGAPLFTVRRAMEVLDGLARRRLGPAERVAALRALHTWSVDGSRRDQLQRRVLEWAHTVAAAEGEPAWDTRELFWLDTLERHLQRAS